MLIDFHTHAFPDALASHTMDKLSAISGYTPTNNGTTSGLMQLMAANGVKMHVIMHIAVKTGQHKKVNEFAASAVSGVAKCFGSVHPNDEGIDAIIGSFRQMGLSGVKLHPDYQEFFADSLEAMKLYEKIEQAGLPVLFHAGVDPLSPNMVHCTPKMLATISSKFPKLAVIGAHMGGMLCFDDVERYLVGLPNVYFDTSMAAAVMPPEQFERIVKNHGPGKILFGSDAPWGARPEVEAAYIKSLGLGQQALDMIFYQNALRVLNIQETELSKNATLFKRGDRA
ncbi:MAG: amidohydrolase family protein [Eubacteriaceae bacterium]|nr:amidohydrolase family protein [Eubacteriaceae bacterium]